MPRCRTWRYAALAATAASLSLAPLSAGASVAPNGTHVVQSGETLSTIASDLGSDTAELATLNQLDDANLLHVGQALKVPASAAPQPPATSPPAAASYTVVDGDTLWSIAHRFATSVDALAQANHLDDPNRLPLGAHLTVPPGAPAAAAPLAMAAPPRPSLLVAYTVQPGDTLNQIAHQFGVRAAALAQANALDDPNRLALGLALKVPVPGREHVVTAGETLRDIASEEKVDLGSLVDFNQLQQPELIRVGQVVLVPVPAAAGASAPAAPGPSAPAAPGPSAPAAPGPSAPAAAGAPAAPGAGAALMAAAAAPSADRPAPPAPAAAPSPPKGGLVGLALRLLGAPYVWGGSSPSGFDCSGFVWYVARQSGHSISRGLQGQYSSGPHPARDQLKPGDLVFFQGTYKAGLSHNGIYIGNGKFVSAADEAAGVTISSLGTPYWTSHWFGATRLP